MLGRLKALRDRRQRKQAAIRRALEVFHQRRGATPMAAQVLHLGPTETIVRVAYMTDHIPPDRAWYAVSEIDDAVRALSFADVAHLETVWR